MEEDKITFKDALKILGIEDYHDKIINSNSHGELFHIHDYFILADLLKNWLIKDNPTIFREWFEYVVKYAEKNWERPQSIYQHILKTFKEHINESL